MMYSSGPVLPRPSLVSLRHEQLAKPGAHHVGNLHDADRLTPAGLPAVDKASRRPQGVPRLDHIPRISEEFVHLTGLISRPGGCATMSQSLNTVRPRNMVRTTRPRNRRSRYGVSG